MLPGPVFFVELVTTARRLRFFLVRWGYAACLLLLVFTTWTEIANRQLVFIGDIAEVAREFFLVFSLMQIVAVLVTAAAMAAGTIAVERERRTIEYLFVSSLTDGEIVFGKLLARLLAVTLLVLVGLPVLSIVMLAGGIAPDMLWGVFAVTLATMLSTTSFSIWISVWTQRARDAAIRVFLILGVVLIVPVLLWDVVQFSPYPTFRVVNDAFLRSNPVVAVFHLLRSSDSMTVELAWQDVYELLAVHLVITLVAMVLAPLSVRRAHVRAAGAPARRRAFLRLPRWRRELGDRRPMVWKEFFARSSMVRLGIIGNVIVAALFAGFVVMSLVVWWLAILDIYYLSRGSYRHSSFFNYTITVFTLTGCVTLLLVAVRAASSVTREKEADTWNSLLASPLTGREIVAAKIDGQVFAQWPIFALLAFLFLLGATLNAAFLFVAAIMLLTLVNLVHFVSAVGVRYSLGSRSSLRAMGATLATVIFVGGGYWFCCAPVTFLGRGAPAESSIAIVMIMSPAVPFLLAAPGVFFVEEHTPSEFVFACIIGNIGYFAAGIVLRTNSVEAFDRICGRIPITPWRHRTPPRP